MSHVRRVLILCGDADGNLGDRAILRATCACLHRAADGVAITVVSADAQRTRREMDAAALPGGVRGFAATWRAARQSDLVICGGGGLFQDDDSLIKMPYWAARVALARLGCRRVAGLSLGVGPLRARVSRGFGKLALDRLQPLSVRDPLAQELAGRLTEQPVELAPDPALLLEPAPDAQAAAVLRDHGVPLDGRPLIGVAPRRWFPPRARVVPHRLAWRCRLTPAHEQRGNETLAGLLAQTLDQLIDRHHAHVVFLPSYTKPHEADDRVCDAIAGAMRSDAHTLIRLDEPALYKAVTARLSVMLGGRMHPTIFAAASGTPVVGLAYNPKFHGLFELLGVPERIVRVAEFVEHRKVDQLAAAVDAALAGEPGLAERAAALGAQTRAYIERLVKEAA